MPALPADMVRPPYNLSGNLGIDASGFRFYSALPHGLSRRPEFPVEIPRDWAYEFGWIFPAPGDLRPKAFPAEPKDLVGAGDNFNAGFLAGLIKGYNLAASLQLGCACGALSTRAIGGTEAQATLEEALALIESTQS